MQAAQLRARTGCSETDQKDWTRKSILLPVVPGNGPGRHARYDEANILAAAIAVRMKQAHLVVTRYGDAFRKLHDWLRNRPPTQWQGQWAIFEESTIVFSSMNKPLPSFQAAFIVDLGIVYQNIPTEGRDLPYRQLPLEWMDDRDSP